jgi:hypothetical protein
VKVGIRRGTRKWNFTYRNGELLFEAPDLEQDEHGRAFVAMPCEEDFKEVERMLKDKVGNGVDVEGTYSIHPGRPAKLSWKIASPTH